MRSIRYYHRQRTGCSIRVIIIGEGVALVVHKHIFIIIVVDLCILLELYYHSNFFSVTMSFILRIIIKLLFYYDEEEERCKLLLSSCVIFFLHIIKVSCFRPIASMRQLIRTNYHLFGCSI